MPKFVILNLADVGRIGPVSRVKKGLEGKIQASGKTIAIGRLNV